MKGSSQHALHLYGEVMRRLSWFSRKILPVLDGSVVRCGVVVVFLA